MRINRNSGSGESTGRETHATVRQPLNVWPCAEYGISNGMSFTWASHSVRKPSQSQLPIRVIREIRGSEPMDEGNLASPKLAPHKQKPGS